MKKSLVILCLVLVLSLSLSFISIDAAEVSEYVGPSFYENYYFRWTPAMHLNEVEEVSIKGKTYSIEFISYTPYSEVGLFINGKKTSLLYDNTKVINRSVSNSDVPFEVYNDGEILIEVMDVFELYSNKGEVEGAFIYLETTSASVISSSCPEGCFLEGKCYYSQYLLIDSQKVCSCTDSFIEGEGENSSGWSRSCLWTETLDGGSFCNSSFQCKNTCLDGICTYYGEIEGGAKCRVDLECVSSGCIEGFCAESQEEAWEGFLKRFFKRLFGKK